MKYIVLLISIITLSAGILFFSKNEQGVIDSNFIESCRYKVEINEGDLSTYYHKFTCNYQTTSNNKILGGECLRYTTKLFNKSCHKLYFYQISPYKNCTEYIGENSYLNKEGVCQCDYGYIPDNNACITKEQSCKNKLGNNATYLNNECTCQENYSTSINSSGKCVSIYSGVTEEELELWRRELLENKEKLISGLTNQDKQFLDKQRDKGVSFEEAIANLDLIRKSLGALSTQDINFIKLKMDQGDSKKEAFLKLEMVKKAIKSQEK